MNTATIEALVLLSLNGPRTVHTGHVADPAAYIANLRAKFLENRVASESEIVFLERPAIGVSDNPGQRQVYMVCRADPQSVFWDPATESFGCAWGPELPELRYVDLGFRSQDVLEMLSA